MPELSWFHSCDPEALRPLADPYSTTAAPARSSPDTVLPGAPTARSAKPSPLKSPEASDAPNWSLEAAEPATPDVSSDHSVAPEEVSPELEPRRTSTTPASVRPE